MHVTIKDAEKIIAAAVKEAERTKTQMCIAVVDSGADLKAFFRMDGAWVGSIDIAIKKAKTAVFFGMPTGAIGKLSQPGGPLFGIEHSNDGLITFPGGLPIVDNEGVLVGAIGVSGSSVENDHISSRGWREAGRRVRIFRRTPGARADRLSVSRRYRRGRVEPSQGARGLFTCTSSRCRDRRTPARTRRASRGRSRPWRRAALLGPFASRRASATEARAGT